MKLHGEEVNVGDKVWHVINGWGEVVEIDDDYPYYPILVHWDGRGGWFTGDGKFHTRDETPTLYWQPFELPKKPKQMEKAWQWIYKLGNRYRLTNYYYVSKEEVLERNSNVEPIEPYLPSEIEREVKK